MENINKTIENVKKMSRLTANDAKSLIEAYSNVYTSQELTEEQVWEEVENWVNSLLKEGHDLSDYTWEEMYESYLQEQGNRRGGNRDRGTGIKLSLPGGSTGSGLGRQGAKRAADARASAPRVSNIPSSAGRPQVSNIPPQEGTGKGAPGAGSPSIASKPVAAASKPAAAPSAPKPAAAASKPAAAPSAPKPAAAASKPATAPSSDSPSKQSTSSMVSDIRAMRARSLERQGKPAAAAGVSATTKPAFKEENVDAFDTVIGHLLDEGYADTEDSALAIMANMSEEWKNSIVEAQRARENPDGHDKEEKKKYAPVRGEKTPMPPRGDKRREDFEKWYAKNVR
jgi:hypothetical protein